MVKTYRANFTIVAEKFDTSIEQIIRYNLQYATNRNAQNDDLEFLLSNDMGTEIVHVGDIIATNNKGNSFVINKNRFKKYYTPVE